MRASIYMMARAPAIGRCKTRLAAATTPEIAARLYRAFVLDTWDALEGVASTRRVLAYTGELAEFPARMQREEHVEQPPGDLGEKMAHLVSIGLANGPAVVLVGSDVPGVPSTYIDAAIDGLAAADAVLGPSTDGGFYTMALGRPLPGRLAGIPWGTAHALSRTVDLLRGRGLRVGFAPSYDDVDDIATLAALGERIHAGDVWAPATAASLSMVEAELWR